MMSIVLIHRTHCKNNLTQLSLLITLFLKVISFYFIFIFEFKHQLSYTLEISTASW